MPFDGSPGGASFDEFVHRLGNRLYTLACEMEEKNGQGVDSDFVMPVGMFLVLDAANGGGVTADELVRRFHLLHAESKNAIDFYFLGWQWRDLSDHSKGIRFDLKAFEKCRDALKHVGIKTFGGSADLILVDVWYRHNPAKRDYTVEFNFPEAISVNLATSREQKRIQPIGDFLQSVIAVSEELQEQGKVANTVFAISDKLGIAVAKRSILDFFLAKWGKIIGADKLAVLAVRNLGPVARLHGHVQKDNVLLGDIPAVSLPRGRNPRSGVLN